MKLLEAHVREVMEKTAVSLRKGRTKILIVRQTRRARAKARRRRSREAPQAQSPRSSRRRRRLTRRRARKTNIFVQAHPFRKQRGAWKNDKEKKHKKGDNSEAAKDQHWNEERGLMAEHSKEGSFVKHFANCTTHECEMK